MKITNVKSNEQRPVAGFTLIEMIGVLAVIAILAALLLPKVANAISEARVNNTAGSYQTLATATTDHYGKYNAFNTIGGTNTLSAPSYGYDTNVLMPEGFLDKPFAVKIGTGNQIVQLMTGTSCNGGSGYLLDGVHNGTVGMTYVVEAVITNVAAQDAFDLSQTIDGGNLTPTTVGTADTAGKVTYSTANGGTVYMFITGR